MHYDEIDQYVDRFFREKDAGPADEVLHGEVLSGDWRIDKFDQFVRDGRDKDLRWQKLRISEDRDPGSGSQDRLPLSWDDPSDDLDAWTETTGSSAETRHGRNGNIWREYSNQIQYYDEVQRRDLTLAEYVMIGMIGIIMILLMMVIS